MRYSNLLLSLFFLSFTYFNRVRAQEKISNESDRIYGKKITIELKENYQIKGELNNEFASDSCYSNVKLFRDNKQVYRFPESSLIVISDTINPILYKIGKSNILFLTYDDTPDANKTLSLLIENNKVVRIDTLPEFDHYPTDIENNSEFELQGFMNFVDAYCLDCDSSYYDPTLVYKVTESGVKLDSLKTIEINKDKWGGFYGYKILYKAFPEKK